MKKIILLMFSNLLFSQNIPEPKETNIAPPTIVNHLDLLQAEVEESMQPFINTTKYGLGIIKYNALNNYSSTGASFAIFNPSNKTIKYIWFTIAGENPVGDLVPINKGQYYKTIKGIGPVEPNNIAEWSFDYVWFTDVVEYLRLSNIKIQYMDGSVKVIKYNKNMFIGEDSYDNMIKAISKKRYAQQNQHRLEERSISKDPNEVYDNVDQSAEFPGGISAFRKIITDQISESISIGNDGIVKTEITFIVESDGLISNIKANGDNVKFNSTVEQVITLIKKRWSPAKINGQSVRSYFRLPLTYNFEN